MSEGGGKIGELLRAASSAIGAGDWIAAERALTDCVALKPDDPATSYNLALVEKRLGKLEAAAARLEFVLSLLPDHANARFERAAALMDLGAVADALGEFETYLGAQPDDPDARLNAALLCLRLGRPQEAENHLAVAEKLRSGDPAIRLARAEAARDTGNVESASTLYRRLYAEVPGLRPAILKSMSQGPCGRLPLYGLPQDSELLNESPPTRPDSKG